jgi:hypothetical protein
MPNTPHHDGLLNQVEMAEVLGISVRSLKEAIVDKRSPAPDYTVRDLRTAAHVQPKTAIEPARSVDCGNARIKVIGSLGACVSAVATQP